VLAAKTTLPVLGVPMKGWSLDGLDSLLSTVQMPRGVPVGTLAIGEAGAVNAALLAGQILGLKHPKVRDAVVADREARRQEILDNPDPRK
jgi:5-(carboxyamino)imidazole ribonucleotide mutase